MLSIIAQMYEEAAQDRQKMLADYVTDEYISCRLTVDEIVKMRDMIAAAAVSQRLDDLAKALEMPEAYLFEMFEIPVEVAGDWHDNGVPDCIKKMIVCAVVPEHIDTGRCHTCQECGEFFFSSNSKEVMCEDCRREIGGEALARYVFMRMHKFTV